MLQRAGITFDHGISGIALYSMPSHCRLRLPQHFPMNGNLRSARSASRRPTHRRGGMGRPARGDGSAGARQLTLGHGGLTGPGSPARLTVTHRICSAMRTRQIYQGPGRWDKRCGGPWTRCQWPSPGRRRSWPLPLPPVAAAVAVEAFSRGCIVENIVSFY